MDIDTQPMGDNAIIISFGNHTDSKIHEQVRNLTAYLEKKPFAWMTGYVPAFSNVSVFYDPVQIMRNRQPTSPYVDVRDHLLQAIKQLPNEIDVAANIIEIPVCYGGDKGPDLAYVAEKNGLSEEEVIAIHSEPQYFIHMIGFVPGFPYIGGMSEKISTPRKDTPRLKIPAGSVGIAGAQTGIYPITSPGGWQIIGQTPTSLFRPDAAQSSLLKAGNSIRFKPVDEKTFQEWDEHHD